MTSPSHVASPSWQTIWTSVCVDLRRQWMRLLACDILFKLAILAAIGPITSWIVSRLMALSGQQVISNEAIASFVLSPLGILLLTAMGGVLWAVTFLEISGILMLQYGKLAHREVPILRAGVSTLKRWPAFIQLALLLASVFAIVATPCLFCIWEVYRRLLSEFDINYYINEKPPEFWQALGLAGACVVFFGLIAMWLYARLIFAIPECVLMQQSPVASLRSSFRMTSAKTRFVFQHVFSWALGVAALSASLAVAIQWIEAWVLSFEPGSFSLLAIFIGLLLTLNFAVGLVVSSAGGLTHALMIGQVYLAISQLPRAPNGEGYIAPPGIELIAATVAHEGRQQLTKARLIIVVLGTVFLASGIFTAIALNQIRIEDNVQVTAHRGSSNTAPENTISAIQQAILDGVDCSEIDVQETVDGVIVVFHDADFMRIGQQPQNIWETTFEDVRKIDAGRWFDEKFAGEQIPTLAEVLQVARGKIRLNIELKFNGHAVDLAARTVRVIQEQQMLDECFVSSLNHEALAVAKDLEPKLDVAAIVGASIGNLMKLKTDIVSINIKSVTPQLVRGLHARGKEIHVWTVNDEAQMTRMLQLGVDNILTDRPEALMQLLEERRQLSQAERLLLAFRVLVEN